MASPSYNWRDDLENAKSEISTRIIKMRELEMENRKKDMVLRKMRGSGAFHWRSKIVVGVCAMEKKATCKPMRAMLGRLPSEEFSTKIFEEKVILEDPIESWPVVDCLIAFYSTGFPLAKVESYVALRRPYLINDLGSQRFLWDRRNVYKICKQNDIPVPNHIIVDRDKDTPDELVETDDYIEVNGKRMNKPFVEKPVDADCHDVFIYYPKTSGGGRKELFRKIENRSSEFYPDRNNVRRNGSYIYEEFLATEGTDVKVYAVTMDYAHAEARKSPVMDGRVVRDEHNVELRYPVILSTAEKEIARRVVKGFKQNVCGFDLLRVGGRSYVCDVNGWSFVKRSVRYSKDSSLMLARLMRGLMGRPPQAPLSDSESDSEDDSKGEDDTEVPGVRHAASVEGLTINSAGKAVKKTHEELRAVIAIVRHGDRTPKQKLKMMVTDRRFLELFARYGKENKIGNSTSGTAGGASTPNLQEASPPPPKSHTEAPELKLKTAKQLGDILRITNEILLENANTRAMSPPPNVDGQEDGEEDGVDGEFGAQLEAFTQVRAVLEMHGTFRGINRKVQLRCTKTVPETGEPIEAQLILKWGGILTPQGRERAEMLGRSFRERMYPGIDGLIRLHSTYRHDLKIYASDEGRVQVTAAAFAKGLLDLEGHLTPILESLVKKGPEVDVLLHDASLASSATTEAKQKLKTLLTTPNGDKLLTGLPFSVQQSLRSMEPSGPIGRMAELHQEITDLVTQIKFHIRNVSKQKQQALRTRGSVTAAALRGLRPRSSSLAEKSVFVDVSPSSPFSHKLPHQSKIEVPKLEPMGSRQISSTEGNAHQSSVMASLGTELPTDVQLDVDSNDVKVDRGDGPVSLADMFHLAYARWEKLRADFFRKDNFDISKIPDIYDSAKYDITHNPEILKLTPRHLLRVYDLSKHLADAVVPQEYGETPKDKFEVGIKTASSLMGKIHEDLRVSAEEGNMQTDRSQAGDSMTVDSDTRSEAPSDEGGFIEGAGFRLDRRLAKSMGIKNANRHVRTRLYFTSESHLHAVMNVLRYAHLANSSLPKPSENALKRLSELSEMSYLCHVVIKLYEVTEPNGIKHHVVRVYISDGISIKIIEPANLKEDVSVVVGTQATSNPSKDEADTSVDLHPSGFGFSSFHQNIPLSPAVSGASKKIITGGGHHLRFLPPANPLIPLWPQLSFGEALRLFDHTLLDFVPMPLTSGFGSFSISSSPKDNQNRKSAGKGYPLQRFTSRSVNDFVPLWTKEEAEEEEK